MVGVSSFIYLNVARDDISLALLKMLPFIINVKLINSKQGKA